MNIFADIGIMIIVATIGGFIARYFKQPLIPAYIIMGIVIGPVLGLIKDMNVVDVLSEIGIAFLLFIVGIELDLARLKDVGSIASIGSLIQMGLAFLAGFGAFLWLGFSYWGATYAGIILMFSSTMVVIKLLADKAQLDTLHGRLVIGILLMQDVVVVLMLSVFSTKGGAIGPLVLAFLEGILVFVVAIFFSKVIFPSLFKFAARNQELFFLLSIAVCFTFSLVFVWIGFTIAIGAFVAGLMLGNLPYNAEIISKVKGLRDFFATVFFVSIGAKLALNTVIVYVWPFMILLLLTIIFSPFITFLTIMMFGYNRRVAFLAAVSLSQVSAFSLIAVHQGIVMGHLDAGFMSLTIMVALGSMMVSAYMIKFEDKIYSFMLPFLKKFDRLVKHQKKLHHHEWHAQHDVLLLGYDRIGYNVYKKLLELKRDVMIVDFDPDVVKQLMDKKVPCVYGDINDDEVFDSLHIDKVKLVISSIPDHRTSKLLIQRVRHHNKNTSIILTAYTVEEALELYEDGADYVILPHLLGGKHASYLLESFNKNIDALVQTKLDHITELKEHKQRYKKRSLYMAD